MTTICLPLFSGRLASWSAAQTAAPGGDADRNAVELVDLLADRAGVVLLHA